MANFDLLPEEVVLYEGSVTSKNYKGTILLTLTSLKLVFEKEKGIFKKERELVEIVALDTVKTYNDAAQIKQKGDTVEVQTVSANIALTSLECWKQGSLRVKWLMLLLEQLLRSAAPKRSRAPLVW